MKAADRCGASWTLIVGEEELKSGQALLKNMVLGSQQQIQTAKIVEAIAELYREEGSRK